MYNFIKDKLKGQAAGFTLTELIIVIVIIAILASVMYPSLTGYIAKAKRINDISLIKELNDNNELNTILDEDINININNYKTHDVLLFNKIDQRYYLYSIKNNTLYNENSDNIELSKDYYYFDDSLDLDNIFTLYTANDNDDDSIIEEPATPIPKEDNTPKESSSITPVFITRNNNGNTVNEYNSLEEVLASSDTYVYLYTNDYVINNEITINKSLTIDLNKHTLTLNNNLIIDNNSSVVKIINSIGKSSDATININNNYAIINNSNNNNNDINLNMSNFTINGNVTNNGKCNIDNMVINGTVENIIICNIANSTVTTIKDSSNGYILYMMTLKNVTITNIVKTSTNICIHSGIFYSNPTGCSVISTASLTYDSSNEYWVVN